MKTKKDIATEADIRQMVDEFYNRVRQDDMIGPVFDNAIQDWSQHLPVMYRFWDTLLLGSGTYKGSPFDKHVSLPIDAKHFQRWVALFEQNIDDLFDGPLANEAKSRARSIASVFQFKMETMKSI